MRSVTSHIGSTIMPAIEPPRKVLIVEDDRCLQTILCNSIRMISPHAEVDWALNGESGFDKMEKTSYHLVIADYLLPGFMDGLLIWERCKSEYPSSAFILMSGLSVEEFLKMTKGKKSPPPFLLKPFMRSEFCTIVKNALALDKISQAA